MLQMYKNRMCSQNDIKIVLQVVFLCQFVQSSTAIFAFWGAKNHIAPEYADLAVDNSSQ